MTKKIPEKISTTQAAEILGCTMGRVQQLLIEGILEGEKFNERAWMIDRKSVERYARLEFASGRPRVGR